MTVERRGDDNRIDQILAKVGHIDSEMADTRQLVHELGDRLTITEDRVRKNENDLTRANAMHDAVVALMTSEHKSLHEKINGIGTGVAKIVTDFHTHTAQESRDRRALLIAIVTGIAAFAIDRWAL